MLVDPGNLIKNMTLARLEVVTEVHQPSLSLSLSLSLSRLRALSLNHILHTHTPGAPAGNSINQPAHRARRGTGRSFACLHARGTRTDGLNPKP
jgi:hypothetical protein